MQRERQTVMVWDPFVRVFHWTLVLAYLLVWLSAEEWATLHERIGYFILIAVGLRVVWGLVGSRHARFRDFVYGPRNTLAYLQEMWSGRPRHFLGHNPAGGWMVVALLAGLAAASGSGILMAAAGSDQWEELHEGLAYLTLVLVAVHVAGVLVGSLVHRENLIRAMWTGRKLGGSKGV